MMLLLLLQKGLMGLERQSVFFLQKSKRYGEKQERFKLMKMGMKLFLLMRYLQKEVKDLKSKPKTEKKKPRKPRRKPTGKHRRPMSMLWSIWRRWLPMIRRSSRPWTMKPSLPLPNR